MQTCWTVLIVPVVVGVIVLVIEYWIVQPMRKAREETLLPPGNSISGDWSSAMRKAIAEFRSSQGGHEFPLIGEHFKIEEAHIDNNHAVLTVAVMPKSSLLFAVAGISAILNLWGVFPNVIARYELTIDDTGDILGVKSIPVKEDEKYRELFPSYIGRRPISQTHRRKEGIVLKEIKKPVTKLTHKGLKVRVEFIVENWGPATTIYPYVEYKVAELKAGKYEERVATSPSSWKVDLKANSSTPIVFDRFFDATAILLTKPPNKVTVRLHRKPIS